MRQDAGKKNSKRPQEDDRHKKQRVLVRTWVLLLIFGVAAFLPLFAQLFKLQIVEHDYYQERAADQQTRDLTVSADRGTIYDNEGNLLAISGTVQTLVLSPKDLNAAIEANEKLKAEGSKKYNEHLNKEYIAQGLSDLTGVGVDTILQRMERSNSQYEVLARKMEEETATAVRAFIAENRLGNGVYLTPDSKRYYPYSTLASHIIGFVGSENTGLYGAEYEFNDGLSGTSGRVVTAKNGSGTELLSKYENYIDAQDGLDHHLTINATIQGFAEKALEEGIEKYDVRKGGFCIVMEPNTGAILAMASSPNYDLNAPSAIEDAATAARLAAMKEDPAVGDDEYQAALAQARSEQWRNRCTTDTYEPGSTFKIITLASALEEGVVDENSQFYCSGSLRVADWNISCSKHSGHGQQDLMHAVQNSCNPAFMTIGMSLGAEKFYDYMEDFGILSTTGIDLESESGSRFWTRKTFTAQSGLVSLATASFGQTFRCTPIQLITAVGAAVNGGHLMVPHILDYTTDADGNIVNRVQPTEVRQVISEETSATVRDILETVVSSATGTGKNSYQPGYRIGGKTGTSQKRDEDTGDLIVSYVGIAPANDPKVVVLLAYDSPTPSTPGGSWTAGGTYISGGNMAAPMAGKLIAQILDYLGVEKQYSAEELSGADTIVPQTVGSTEEQAAATLKNRGFTYRKVGDGGRVTGQIPTAGAVVPGGSQIVLYMGEEQPEEPVEVPDLGGLSPDKARQALAACNLFMKGTGSAQFFTSSTLAGSQSLPPGTMVAPGTVVEVTFVENVTDFAVNILGG